MQTLLIFIALVVVLYLIYKFVIRYGYVIGQPKEYPETLVEGLKKLYSELGYIEAAHLALIFRKSDGLSQHLIIGIDVPAEKFKEAVDKSEQVFKSVRTGKVFEIINTRDKKNYGILKSMSLFYKK